MSLSGALAGTAELQHHRIKDCGELAAVAQQVLAGAEKNGLVVVVGTQVAAPTLLVKLPNGIRILLLHEFCYYLGRAILEPIAHDYSAWIGVSLHDESMPLAELIRYALANFETAKPDRLRAAQWMSPPRLEFSDAETRPPPETPPPLSSSPRRGVRRNWFLRFWDRMNRPISG